EPALRPPHRPPHGPRGAFRGAPRRDRGGERARGARRAPRLEARSLRSGAGAARGLRAAPRAHRRAWRAAPRHGTARAPMTDDARPERLLHPLGLAAMALLALSMRSEERRVGKEGRGRSGPAPEAGEEERQEKGTADEM